MARASVIFVAFHNAAEKAAAKKQADEAQKKAAEAATLDDRNHFKDLVTKYSTDDASKRAGGDIRYLSAAETEERLGKEAKTWLFSADLINAVSPVFEGPTTSGSASFQVLKRTGKRKEISRTFDQVKNQIKNVVFREKRSAAFNDYVEELKKKHGVTLYADKLDRVKVNAQLPPNVDAEGNALDPHSAMGNGPIPGMPPAMPPTIKAGDDDPDKDKDNDEGGEGNP